MFSFIFGFIVGALVGWNFPQPQYAKDLQVKLIAWFKGIIK